jgi:hypothetical protein
MEDRIVSQQSITTLLNEIHEALADSDTFYLQVMARLKDLDPFLNLKLQTALHTEPGKKALVNFKEPLKNYFIHLERQRAAYQDLSVDLQTVLSGRGAEDPLFQEIERQGALLAEEINVRQEAGKILHELVSLIDRIALAQKASPNLQKKVEDIVFRLQMLS